MGQMKTISQVSLQNIPLCLFQLVYKNHLLEYRISGELKWRGLKTKWKWRCKCRVSGTGNEVESDWYLGRASTLADALRRLNM